MEVPDGYAARQRSRDEDYRRAYEAWVVSLPPEERSQLASMGLEGPQMPDTRAGGMCDASELSRCTTAPALPEEEDWTAGPPVPAQPADKDSAHDLLRVLVGELLSQDNARLSVECLALVTGLSYLGDSMTTIARRYNVTRAAVSKRCVEFTRALRLEPCRAMRSLKARQSYRKSRINHLDKQP